MERQIIQYNDKPLLEVGNEFNRFNHMLKKKDRKNVPAVMEYLHRRGMDVYLGGSAVSGWIFKGNRNYNDVDILGIARSEIMRLDLVEGLRSLSYSSENELNRSSELKINNAGFKVINMNSESTRLYFSRLYLLGSIDERFILHPTRGFLANSSSIDVSLPSTERFLTKSTYL